MSWVKLDDGFTDHPKIAALTDKEFRVWCAMVAFCSKTEDPTVDDITRRNVDGLTPRLCERFTELSLLDRKQDFYEVHDWWDYRQFSGEQSRNVHPIGRLRQGQIALLDPEFSSLPKLEVLDLSAKNKELKTEDLKTFCNLWLENSPPLIKHRESAILKCAKTRRVIDIAIRQYGAEDCQEALTAYVQVLGSPAYWYDHKWRFEDFFSRGIVKFLPESEPLHNFRSRDRQSQRYGRGMTTRQILDMDVGA